MAEHIPRGQVREVRSCWHCHADFDARFPDEVYCSAVCGRAARGLDDHGGPLPKSRAA